MRRSRSGIASGDSNVVVKRWIHTGVGGAGGVRRANMGLGTATEGSSARYAPFSSGLSKMFRTALSICRAFSTRASRAALQMASGSLKRPSPKSAQ